MKPKTADEKLLVLARIIRDLQRIREDAKRVDLAMLGYLLASAEDEARARRQELEGETFTE